MNARLSTSPLAWLRGQRPMHAFLQTVGAQGVILAANLLTGILTARLLGADGRGEYAAVSMWPQLFATLAMAGWSSATVYRMRCAPERGAGIAAAALCGAWLGACVCVAAALLLLPLLMRQYAAPLIAFAQLCLVSVFVNVTHMMLKQTLAGAAAYGRANLTNILPQVLYLPALLALLPFGAMDARAAVLALLVSGALALALLLPGWWHAVRPRFSQARPEFAPLAHYAARAWLGELVFGLATFADRLVLVPLLPPAQLGLYAVAYSFSRLVQLTQPAILSVFFSQLSGRASADAQRLHDRALRVLLVVLAAGCAVLWVSGERLLALAFGPEFVAANAIFRLLAIEASLAVLSQVTVQLFLASDRPGFVSALQAVMLGVSLGALLLVTPAHGALGAAAVLASVALLRFLALLAALRGVLGRPLPRLLLTTDDLKFIARRLP